MRRIAAIAAVPLTALLFTGAAFAQDAGTPAAGGGRVSAIDPSQCVAQPASPDDVAAALAPGDLAGFQLQVPLGQIAPNADTKAVNSAVREVLACLNANDVAKGVSLMTPNAARILYGAVDPANVATLKENLAKTPEAREEDNFIKLVAVTDVSTLADGRLAAFVVLDEPLTPPNRPQTMLFVFTRDGDTLKLDHVLGFSPIPAPKSGTPTPDSTPAS